MIMDPIKTIDYINAFEEAVNTLVLCSGYDTPATTKKFDIVEKKYEKLLLDVDEDIFNIECLINEIREQINIIK